MIHFEINQRIGEKIARSWADNIIKNVLTRVGVNNAEISIAFVNDCEIKKLNKQYRGKNKVTDVLSFIYQIPDTKYEIPLNGEIIICYPQAVRQAKGDSHSVKEEIKLLLVHGLLHLCGYDHEKSLREAERMRGAERTLLEKI